MSMQEVFGDHIDAAERLGNQAGADKLRGLFSQFADLALRGEVPVLPARNKSARSTVIFDSSERVSAGAVRLNPQAVKVAWSIAPRVSQVDLAREFDKTQQTISRWLGGKSGLPIEAAVGIAKRLVTDPSTIVREEDLPKVQKWLEERQVQDQSDTA